MKSFRIAEGDLDIGPSKRASMVKGPSKLIQDLSLWLLEPLGTGYTTPNFGSLLNSRVGKRGAFIGRAMSDQIQAEAEAEVDRVLNLYQQVQIQQIRRAQLDGRLSLYTRSEILDQVGEITSTVDADRAIIKAAISVGNGNVLNLLADIDEEPSIAAL